MITISVNVILLVTMHSSDVSLDAESAQWDNNRSGFNSRDKSAKV